MSTVLSKPHSIMSNSDLLVKVLFMILAIAHLFTYKHCSYKSLDYCVPVMVQSSRETKLNKNQLWSVGKIDTLI
jgi:hypothetical protein